MLFPSSKQKVRRFLDTKEDEVELCQRKEVEAKVNNNFVKCLSFSIVYSPRKCQFNKQLCSCDSYPVIRELKLYRL